MLTRRTVIQVAQEATYGTSPGTFGIVLAWDVDPDFFAEKLNREVLRDTLSQISHKQGMRESSLTFKTEVKSGGLSGTGLGTPEMDLLLQGCGFGTASHAATSPIIYSLKSDEDNIKSVALDVYIDEQKHRINGARGTVKFTLEAGKFGIAEWEFKGLWEAVSASTLPDISGASVIAPPIVYASDFQISGFNPVTSNLEIDLANNVSRRENLNATFGVENFRVAGRLPTMSFNADAVVEASNPFWGDWAGEIVNTFGIIIGSAVINENIKFTGFVQTDTNKYGDDEGVRIYEIAASLVSSSPGTSDDELLITFS